MLSGLLYVYSSGAQKYGNASVRIIFILSVSNCRRAICVHASSKLAYATTAVVRGYMPPIMIPCVQSVAKWGEKDFLRQIPSGRIHQFYKPWRHCIVCDLRTPLVWPPPSVFFDVLQKADGSVQIYDFGSFDMARICSCQAMMSHFHGPVMWMYGFYDPVDDSDLCVDASGGYIVARTYLEIASFGSLAHAVCPLFRIL